MSIIGVKEWGTDSDVSRYLTIKELFDALVEGDALHLLENRFGYEGDKVYLFDEHGEAVTGAQSLFITDAMFDIVTTDKKKIFNVQGFQLYKGTKIIVGLYKDGGTEDNAGIYRVISVVDTIPAVYVSTEEFSGNATLDDTNGYKIKIRIDNYMELLGHALEIDCSGGTHPGSYSLATIAATINTALSAVSVDLSNACSVYNNKLRLDGVTSDGTSKIVFEGVASADATGYLFGVTTYENSTSVQSIPTSLPVELEFEVSSGLGLQQGQKVTIMYDGSNYMSGDIVSYEDTTLTVNITSVTGSGSYDDWNLLFTKEFSSGIAAVLDRELAVIPSGGQKCYVLNPRLAEIKDVAAIRDSLRNTVSLARTKYGGRDFNTLIDEALSYLRFYYGDKFNNFYASDYGLMLVEAMAFMLDTVSFYLSFKAGENYLETARLTSSVSKIARQIGYKVSGATASLANIRVNITPKPGTPPAFYFGKGSSFNVGDRVFSLASDLFIDGSKMSYDAVCFEGEIRTASQTGTGEANQRVELIVSEGKYLASNVSGDVKLIKVVVGGEEFQYVDFFSFDADKQNVYEAEFTAEPPYISFGDGVAGAMPGGGSKIDIEYAVTMGSGGNASVEGEVVSFEKMILKNAVGDLASDAYIIQINGNYYMSGDNEPTVTFMSPSQGGANPETVDSVKINAPASFATARRAVTSSDYIYFINKFSTAIRGAAIANKGLEEDGEISKIIDDEFDSIENTILGLSGLSPTQKKGVIDAIAFGNTDLKSKLNSIVSEVGKVNHVSVFILAIAPDGSYTSPAQSVIDDLQAFLETVRMVATSVSVRDGIEFAISVDALIGVKVKPYYDSADIRNLAEEAVRNLIKGKNFGDDLFLSACYDAVQSIAGISFCDIQLVPYRVMALTGDGQFNDANDNVINGDGSWKNSYDSGHIDGVVDNLDSSATTTQFKSTLTKYADSFWNGARLVIDVGLGNEEVIVENYTQSNGVLTVYPALSSAPSNATTFTVDKDFTHVRVKNTANAGFYEINSVKQINADVVKTEIELGVTGNVDAVSADPKSKIYTDLDYPDDFWINAKMRFIPLVDDVRIENGPEYRDVYDFWNANGEIDLAVGNELTTNSAVGDKVVLAKRDTSGKLLYHVFQYNDDGLNLECVLAGRILVSDKCSVNAAATGAKQITFAGTKKPAGKGDGGWYVAGDFLFISDVTKENYGIYEISAVIYSGGNTVIDLVDTLPNSSESGLNCQYLRPHDSTLFEQIKLSGFGTLDNPNTDEVKGSPEWYALYKNNPPSDILIPVEGLGTSAIDTSLSPLVRCFFDGAGSWKKFFDDRPANQVWNISVLVTTGTIGAGVYRIMKDSDGNYLVTSRVTGGVTRTRVEVDAIWNSTTGEWDALTTSNFGAENNIPLSFQRFGYSYKLFITEGSNPGKYGVLSVTMKEGGTETIVKLKSDLVGFDASGNKISEMFECFFMRQQNDSKDGLGNVIAKNPENGQYEIISIGTVSSYLITKET